MLPRTERVIFQKTGALQFISHLDLMRFMTKALVRAKIPVCYTEGFNPHPKLTFGLPLSVGTQSMCELMEFKIHTEISCEEIKDRLNAQLPPELRVSRVYDAPAGVKLSAIAWAEYEITLDRPIDPSAIFVSPLPVLKQTKSGEKMVDIAPLVRSHSYENGILRVILSADSQSYLNPELIVKLTGAVDYTILRTRCLKEDGETDFV